MASKIDECGSSLYYSFQKQLECYTELYGITRSLCAKIAQSKGDLSPLMESMKQKKDLMEEVRGLKKKSQDDIDYWQIHKAEAAEETASSLDSLLEQTSHVIQQFLHSEKQLQKQLEFYGKND
jgi:cell fate (sporulation/competence/biofilm development) regulator YmcA (YheA/YmcA/DUF963 family)